MKRSTKEIFMRRVGRWLGAGYRFHRYQGIRCSKMANAPRRWQFEWWRKVPGNPLNLWPNDPNNEKGLPRSECWQEDFPEYVRTKDDAVDYALFNTDFLGDFGKLGMESYEALELAMAVSCAGDGAPYSENVSAPAPVES